MHNEFVVVGNKAFINEQAGSCFKQSTQQRKLNSKILVENLNDIKHKSDIVDGNFFCGKSVLNKNSGGVVWVVYGGLTWPMGATWKIWLHLE